MIVTVTTVMLIYGVYVYAVLYRVSRMTGADILGSVKPTPPPGCIECCGYSVPILAVVVLWAILPSAWAGFEVCRVFERRYRYKHGMCLDCGTWLRSSRGKCPGCGVRIGWG